MPGADPAGADPACHGAAPARAALAGNPSDGYGGAVLAFAVDAFQARAVARPRADLTVSPDSELVTATVQRFARLHCPAALGSAIEWSTSVPRGVGLGGSSAIVIATLRALGELHSVALHRTELAKLALAVEIEELGIAAGLQDRIAQSYGGLTFMDFGPEPAYEPLDASLLPPLVIAWRADAAKHSGVVHSDLRARFDRGEATVHQPMAALAELARTARAALLASDHERFARCVDASLDARREMMTLDPRHVAMIDRARACGASANYTGSGGAVVAVCRDQAQRAELVTSLEELGCGTLAPVFAV
jgi:glucuronokinase